jgi:hypothetical protein
MDPSQDLQDSLDAMPDSPPGATVPCPLKDKGKKGPTKPKNPCSGWGMSDDKKEKDFADGFKKLQKDWKTLTADQRQVRIKELANGAASPGVPDVGVHPTKMNNAGELDFSNWRLDLNQDDLDKKEFSDAEAKEFADTVYHETRHAQQWYLMAQKRAAEGKTADEISKELDIPKSVAESAAKDPLGKKDARQACADALYESVYGSKAEARNKTLTDLATTRDTLKKAQQDYEKLAADKTATKKQKEDAFKTWQKAYADRQKIRKDYMNLPEEADAWETAGNMQKHW